MWLFLHLCEELNEIPFQHFVQLPQLHAWFQLQQYLVPRSESAQLVHFQVESIDFGALPMLFELQLLPWLIFRLLLMRREHFDLLSPSVRQVLPYAHLIHSIEQCTFQDSHVLLRTVSLRRLFQNEVFHHCA